jgi:predicted DNA-binding protein with PD1-like motif
MEFSNSRISVFRLKPHQDLKKAILEFARQHGIGAGIVLTCVGSLEQFSLRFANQKTASTVQGHFEIVSLTGTFSADACHLHISVSDETGKTFGGHVLDENLIFTTAEIAISEITDLVFQRDVDETYGYRELVIIRKKNNA